MGAVQSARLVGAFVGTGLLTWLFVWLLRKILPPITAIIAANAACLALACAAYDQGAAAAFSIYAIPQAAWLIIILVAERGRRERESAPNAAATTTRQFGETFEPEQASHRSPDLETVSTKGATAPEAPRAPTATTGPARPAMTANFIMNHWKGLYSLGVSYWLFGFLITVVSSFVVVLIQVAFAGDDGYQPVLSFFTIACTWGFVALVTVWQLVGVWRSANRTIEERRVIAKKAPWAGVAKAMMILGALRSIDVFVESAVPQLEETYRMAFMGDPSLPAFSMRIMRNGTEVEITGGFKYGLTDDFNKLLMASPQIAIVHLDSIGGRIGEVIKLNKIIRQTRLKTYVAHLCASACTVAFAGGTERWMGQSGVLGFHGPAFPGMTQEELNAASSDQRVVMVNSGYDASFVSRALAAPSKDLWTPTLPELQAAHVITGISNGTQFAQSGYGGTIQKGVFAAPLAKNIPILAPLKAKYPADFEIVLDAYYKGYVDGQTEEENNNIIRFFSYFSVRKYTEGASDGAMIDLGSLLVDELNVLRARDPVQCAKFGSTGGGDPDIQYSFPSQIMVRYQSVGAAIINTSVKRPADNNEQVGVMFKRTIAAMRATFPQSQLALLAVTHPTAQQAPEYCAVIVGLYQQVLKSPPTEATAMLRSLMKL